MNYKLYNDFELIYMIRENDDVSQNIIFDKYKPIIMNIANDYYPKYKKYGYEFDDFLQEATIGFQKALFSFDETRNNLFYTFAIICIQRRLLSFCRSLLSNKYKYTCVDNVAIEDVTCIDINNNIDNIFAEKEMESIFKGIIFDLSWDEGLVFELRMNGFQYLEISQLLDIPFNKVGIILKNVRKVVRKKFDYYYCQ